MRAQNPWPDHLEFFRYAENLRHLTFSKYRAFIERDFKERGGGLVNTLVKYPIFRVAAERDPEMRPWLHWLFHLYDPSRPCNLRPFLVPAYAEIVRRSTTRGQRSGTIKRRKEADARTRVLRVAQDLYDVLMREPEIAGLLLKDWGDSGDVGFERHDLAPFREGKFNLDRAAQEIKLLNRKADPGHPKVGPQINDIDSFVFAVIFQRVVALGISTKRHVLREIAKAVRTTWEAVEKKIEAVPAFIDLKPTERASGRGGFSKKEPENLPSTGPPRGLYPPRWMKSRNGRGSFCANGSAAEEVAE